MSPEDPLAHAPFAYRKTKDGQVRITCDGKMAKILVGKEADRFLVHMEGAGDREAQLLMARVTGQFKFGNERMSRDKGKRL
jgi:hypothetical protein